MTTFFSALNPLSSDSGSTFSATGRVYSKTVLEHNMPDVTLDAIIPFLWSRDLSVIDGIYETFTVLYGDHFDKNSRGFGQKGVLDFTLFPLLSRKLIADTYLKERKDDHVLNFLAWTIALPIKAINFTLAMVCTVALIPVILVVTLIRWLGSKCTTPDPFRDCTSIPMSLSVPTAYAALHAAVHRLELAEINTPDNIRCLLKDPQNLALVYAMDHWFNNVFDDDNGYPSDNQEIFNFLLRKPAFWTDVRVIEYLRGINKPCIQWVELEESSRGDASNLKPNSYPLRLHNSITQSVLRLEKCYKVRLKKEIPAIDASIAQKIRNYDRKLVGNCSDQQIIESLNSLGNSRKCIFIELESTSVSLEVLVGYCWAAVQDHYQWRKGVTREMAEASFYAAIYEIAQEENKEDTSSLFNIMIKSMAKIHKLCEVDFNFPSSEALKLPYVIRDALKWYLEIYKEENVLDQLKKGGLSAVWPQIRSKVVELMEIKDPIYAPEELLNADQYINLTQDEISTLEIDQDGSYVQKNNNGMIFKQ